MLAMACLNFQHVSGGWTFAYPPYDGLRAPPTIPRRLRAAVPPRPTVIVHPGRRSRKHSPDAVDA